MIAVSAMTSAYAGSTLDPVLSLLDPDGRTVLERADNTNAGENEVIRYNVLANGTYYVKVTSFAIDDDPTASDDRDSNIYRVDVTTR